MRIAIVGCGWTGSMLANRLTEYGNVDVYEISRRPKVVCGQGIPTKEFEKICEKHGLHPEDYILWRGKRCYMKTNYVRSFPITNLCTFDKQRFIDDLIKTSSANFHFAERLVHKEKYDLIVDATGKRAILGKAGKERIIPCVQYKVKFDEMPLNDFYLDMTRIKAYGSLWFFPLGENVANVGSGALNGAVAKEQVESFFKRHPGEILEKMGKLVRMASPKDSLPFTKNDNRIVGCGESIGTISHNAEGNEPCVKCVDILIEHIHDLENYKAHVLREFKNLESEHKFIRAVIKGNSFQALRYRSSLTDCMKKIGLKVSLTEMVQLFLELC